MPKPATIIDVAKRANISKSTVSRVLSGNAYGVSEDAVRKVMEAVRELGYVQNKIATSLRTSRTRVILLAIPDITNSFWAEVARGVQDEMEQQDYVVVVANSDWNVEREKRFLDLAGRHRFDAVMLNAFEMDAEVLNRLRCPLVLLGERHPGGQFDVVGSDTHAGVIEGLHHLYEQGHRKVALAVSDIKDNEGFVSSRYRAYRDFHSEKDIALRAELIIKSRLTINGGKALVDQILSLEDRPTAILCGNDLVAIGFLQQCREANIRVPEDFSIMGIDDIPAASLILPALTTIRKPKYQIGVTAAKQLVKRIENEADSKPVRILLKGELIQRETVGLCRDTEAEH